MGSLGHLRSLMSSRRMHVSSRWLHCPQVVSVGLSLLQDSQGTLICRPRQDLAIFILMKQKTFNEMP